MRCPPIGINLSGSSLIKLTYFYHDLVGHIRNLHKKNAPMVGHLLSLIFKKWVGQIYIRVNAEFEVGVFWVQRIDD